MIVLPQSGHYPVLTLAVSPDGQTLACAGGRDQGVAVWDLASRKVAFTLGGQGGKITSVAFSPDGKRLACVNASSLAVWSLAEPRHLVREENWRNNQESSHTPAQACYSPDGRYVATNTAAITYGRAVGLVPVADRPAGLDKVIALPVGHKEATHLTFSSDGALLAVGSFDRTVIVFRVPTRDRAVTLYQGQKVHYVAFSPDGKTLAAGNPQGLVKLFDAASARKLLTLKGQAKPLRALCFSPDGKVIVTAGGEGIVTFWDVESGKSRTAFDWGIGEVFSVCFAADGMRAAAGGRGQVVIWDVDGWEV